MQGGHTKPPPSFTKPPPSFTKTPVSQHGQDRQLSPTSINSMSILSLPVASGYAGIMGYWVKRITLENGEVVTERELREDENRFDGPAPEVGDLIEVQCRGRRFMAVVMWGNSPDRVHSVDTVVSLRVAEVGLDPPTPLRAPVQGPSASRE